MAAAGRWMKFWCTRSELDWEIISRPIDIDRFVECDEMRIRTEDACPDDQSRWQRLYYVVDSPHQNEPT